MRHPYSNKDLMIDCLVMGEYIDLDIYMPREKLLTYLMDNVYWNMIIRKMISYHSKVMEISIKEYLRVMHSFIKRVSEVVCMVLLEMGC